MKISILRSAAVACAAALLSTAAAAQTYPSKPIRLIVPSNPGGGMDAAGRIVGRILTDALGVQCIVDNRSQGTGSVGADAVARSAPDGYTLLLAATTPLATVPSVDPKLSYDPIKDFAPITQVATSDFALAVHVSLPAKTMREFIALARSKPGQINFASVGTGSGAHFTLELLKQSAKLDMVHVPYRGAALAVTALVGGEVSGYFGSGPTLVSHVQAGRIRILASTGLKRMTAFPGVPTANEIVPGVVSYLWFGVAAPAGTSGEIITRLFEVINKGLHDPALTKVILASGAEPVGSASPQEFGGLIKSELAKWSKVAKAGNIQLD
jgi:tripartite-type tricarboxylate transporter receptor subunit TctC